ncbi:uncharacterized protein HMPREF1541_06028 [Cyphellophora europaea CBS 101466]|uniref:Zn(2)-C6 fungal-type domain-containing protein n=1 Tax=Cyphellophora europaea (strain CBS 101466) TaxID=1220924 RepID=W2RTN1_CYPE1|nr:uncharacterized protein HMPREF1541_06028 [Cyphellophora europaea CBS 101466]ETN39802.1 hypothetical protein HMPREF1541_06028 [Cyphellophora europaea CBS 101466]
MSSSNCTASVGPLKLPACERCRTRKVRCDNKPPKCSGCTKSSAACVIVDPVTNERYTRDGLHGLEQKLRKLEDLAKEQSAASPAKTPSDSAHQRSAKSHFVGDGSGLNFFKRLSTTAKASVPHPDESPTAVLRSPYGSSTIPAHSLPPWEVAQTLLTRFSSHVLLHHPLMPHYQVDNILQRVYTPVRGAATDEDVYRIFMVFAISSVTTYRRGLTHEHPYGYFRAALQYGTKVNLIGSLSGVQNLLLIARFAMYYHIDCSIWDMARLCMRQCIALGLHRPPARPIRPMDEQIQRNVFWDCYVHDRYSSGILGRPYAIAEEDITVQLPVEISEPDLLSAQVSSLDDPSLQYFPGPNEVSVFRFVVKLRRITTRISNCFFSSPTQSPQSRRTIADAGRVKMDFNRFMDELTQARNQAPVFPEPKSLYERSDWYDFLVAKDRLTLIRGALAQMPVDGLHPPRGLLEMCLSCAATVVDLYTTLFSRGQITWTRSYFQILFTSGLSIMYTMSILNHDKSSHDPEQVATFARASSALSAASDVMKMFVSEMPDAGRFAVVFEALMKQYTDTGTRARPSRAPTPPVQDNVGQQRQQHAASNGNLTTAIVPSQTSSKDQIQGHLDISGANGQPLQSPQLLPGQPDYGFALELGLDDFQNWSLFPSNPDHILGQMEAGLGEYAWGMPPNDSLFDQWEVFRGPS